MRAVCPPVIRLMAARKYTGATEFGRPCRNLLHGLLFKRVDQWRAGVDNPAGRRRAQAGQAAAADPPIFLASPPRRESEVEREFAAVKCPMVAVATWTERGRVAGGTAASASNAGRV